MLTLHHTRGRASTWHLAIHSPASTRKGCSCRGPAGRRFAYANEPERDRPARHLPVKRTWARLTAAMRGQSQPATQAPPPSLLSGHSCLRHRARAEQLFIQPARAELRRLRALDRRDERRRRGRAHRAHDAAVAASVPDPIRAWLAAVEASAPVLSAADLAFWDEHGYVVLHDAVPRDSREAAAPALWDHLGARDDLSPKAGIGAATTASWCRILPASGLCGQPSVCAASQGFRAALGHRGSVDHDRPRRLQRAGARRSCFRFPGPDLHWDVSLKMPIPSARKAFFI